MAVVLIVEDLFLTAAEVKRIVQQAGHQVLGPARDLPGARAAVARTRPDAALLDVDLGGETSYGLAEQLRDEGVAVVFVTGYDMKDLPEPLREVPVVSKPFSPESLIDVLSAALA